jgi:hypothetical protein
MWIESAKWTLQRALPASSQIADFARFRADKCRIAAMYAQTKEEGRVMSVRKRVWRTKEGQRREAWVVDYVDQEGDRHIETFTHKKKADAFRAKVDVDVRAGVHTAASKSITVAEAIDDWVKSVALEGRQGLTNSATNCWLPCQGRWRVR